MSAYKHKAYFYEWLWYTVFSSESSFDGTRTEVDDYSQALRKKGKNGIVGKTIDTTKDFNVEKGKFLSLTEQKIIPHSFPGMSMARNNLPKFLL